MHMFNEYVLINQLLAKQFFVCLFVCLFVFFFVLFSRGGNWSIIVFAVMFSVNDKREVSFLINFVVNHEPARQWVIYLNLSLLKIELDHVITFNDRLAR